MNFKLWFENIESKENIFHDEILKLIHSDKTMENMSDENILELPLNQLPDESKQAIESQYGNIPDGNIVVDIKNGSITVGDLIDKLASSENVTPTQETPEKTMPEPEEEEVPQEMPVDPTEEMPVDPNLPF